MGIFIWHGFLYPGDTSVINVVCCTLVPNNIEKRTCRYKEEFVNVSEVRGKKKPSPVGFFAQYSKYKLSTLTTAIKIFR